MGNKEENSDLPQLPPTQAMGRLASADALVDDILGETPSTKTAQNKTQPVHPSAPSALSAEEHARRQDLQARLRDEPNPYFD